MSPTRPLAALAGVLAVVAALAVPALAGAPPSTTAKTRELNPGLDRVLERKAELGLSPDQESRLTQIRKDLAEKNRPLREQVEAKTVLQPDQQAKVEKWAKEKQAEMKAKGKSQGKSKSKDASSNAIPSTDAGEPVEQGK